MIKERESTGWGTAVFILLFALGVSYFFLWAPARQEASKQEQQAKVWKQRAENDEVRQLSADQQTLDLVAEAQGLSSNRFGSELRSLGVPAKNITSTPGLTTIELVGSIDQVANWISLTSGRTYINADGQLRGSGVVGRARYQIKQLAGEDQYLLTVELQTLSGQ